MIDDLEDERNTWQDYRWQAEKVYNKLGNSGDIVLWTAEIAIGKKLLTDTNKGMVVS